MLRGSIIVSFVLSFWLVASAQMSIIGDESGRGNKSALTKPVPLTYSSLTSPGFMVGETDYDWPSNGGGRRNICKTPSGGFHFYWTWRPEGNLNMRRAYYRYFKPPNTWSEAKMIDTTCGRMGALSQLKDGRAIATAHVTLDTLFPDNNLSFVYIDSALGAGKFKAIPLPFIATRDSTQQPIWPNVVVDSNNVIFIAASYSKQGMPTGAWWTYSKDTGATWAPWSDTIGGEYLGGKNWGTGGREVMVTRNNKVAIIIRPDSSLTLLYYETEDQGASWKKDTIFEYLPGDSVTPANDSVLPHIWYSGVYDNNNVFHVAYTAVDTTPGGGGGGDFGSGWRSQVCYWSSSTQKSSIVTSGWWASFPGPGRNHTTVSEAQIAIDRSNDNLYCTWTQADLNNDVSEGGLNNLELYGAISPDNGVTWIYQQNMTNSHTPGAAPGACDNDVWHSIGETVSNDVLDIFYMNDKDAGSSVNDGTTLTVNSMRYLKYVISPTGVKNIKNTPKNALRVTMYPNPFRHKIEIRLADMNAGLVQGKNRIRLSIYNTSGRLVKQASMKEKFVWDGKDANGHRLPAGIYFLRLNAGGLKHSTQMVLLK